jgi:hypothetical protein
MQVVAMTETNADLREQIREQLDVPEFIAGSSQLRSTTLEKAVEAIDGSPWGGAPSLRQQIREELDLTEDGEQDASGLRKDDLVALRDALQEGADD